MTNVFIVYSRKYADLSGAVAGCKILRVYDNAKGAYHFAATKTVQYMTKYVRERPISKPLEKELEELIATFQTDSLDWNERYKIMLDQALEMIPDEYEQGVYPFEMYYVKLMVLQTGV